MYPNFRYLVYGLTGIDIPWLRAVQTFGFFLAMAFLLSAWALVKELKRRESLGLMAGTTQKTVIGQPATPAELVSNFFLGFIVGFKLLYFILNTADASGDPAGFLFSTKGNIIGGILLGAVAAYMRYKEKEKERLPEPKEISRLIMPHQRVADIVFLAAVSGVISSKLFYFIEEWQQFIRNPIGELIAPAGMVFYGGLIGAFGVLSWYVLKHKISYVQMMDAVAPSLILAYGIGRQGCHWAGDGDWGVVSGPKPGWLSWLPDFLWTCKYPNNISNSPVSDLGVVMPDCGGYSKLLDGKAPADGFCTQLLEGHFPTPLYETILCVLIFIILWRLRKKLTAMPGMLFAVYLVLNGLERFSVETIRLNDRAYPLGLTQAQWIAVILASIGIGLGYWSYNKAKKQTVA